MSTNANNIEKYYQDDLSGFADNAESRARGLREHAEFERDVEIYFAPEQLASRARIEGKHSRLNLVLFVCVFASVVLFNLL